MKTFLKIAGLAVLAAGSASALAADKLDGRWDAQLVRGDNVIPFRLDISGSGPTLKGTLYDGFRPYENTTSASFKDGQLVLNIEHYLTTITAKFEGGKLVGNVVAQNRENRADYQFVATRHVDAPPGAEKAPSIAGNWEIPLDAPSSKGEKAFRLIVDQKGAEVAASILRVDGDTGSYSGTFKDGKWVLSHFDGSRPGVIVVTRRRTARSRFSSARSACAQPLLKKRRAAARTPIANPRRTDVTPPSWLRIARKWRVPRASPSRRTISRTPPRATRTRSSPSTFLT